MKIQKADLCGRLGVESFTETALAKALSRLPSVGEFGPWIAGGAVRRTMTGEKLDSDFDFFFHDDLQAKAFTVAMSGLGAAKVTQTDKATTFMLPSKTPSEGVYLAEMKVQAITFAYFPNAEAVIDSFDFTLSQFAYDGESVYVGAFSLWDVARKRLVMHRVSYAVSTVRRLMKYAAQGYTVCPGALAELLKQVVADPSVINAETQYID
jgi:hypothetical protein